MTRPFRAREARPVEPPLSPCRPTAVRLRSFSTSGGSTRITRSTSASVLLAPRLKRIELSVRACGRPIALSTCDGSSVPDEQADPDDTAMPSRSRPISSDSDSMRSKLMFVVFGTRGAAAPFRCRARHRREDAPSRADRAAPRRRAPSSRIFCRAQLGGRAEPDDAGHVLGAGAAIALLPAAGHERQQPHALAQPQRADAFRSVELVRRDRQQIDAQRLHVDRNLAGGLHRVGVKQRTVRLGDRGELRDRLNRADLVVGVHHRHERRVDR